MKNLFISTILLEPPSDTEGFLDMITDFLSSWKFLFSGVFAVGVLLIIAGIIISLTKLSKSMGNPQKMQKAKEGIFYSIAALVIAGGLMFFSGVMFNLFK